MEQDTDELYSMLVPLHQHRLIVPRACVAEVVRHPLSEPGDVVGRVLPVAVHDDDGAARDVGLDVAQPDRDRALVSHVAA